MIRNKKDLKYYMREDCRALSLNNANWITKIKDPIYKYECLLRKCEYLRNTSKFSPYLNPIYIYYKIKFRNLGIKLGFSISENTFGPGLSIAHYGNVIVNSRVKVGSNCRIHSGVNIGAGKNEMEVPIIGKNVYIGPGAKIYGGIVIGDNTKIGANAVVNKNFIGDGTLVGIPAKPIRSFN